VAVSGSVAYVADQDAGLQIVDVSNPASLVGLGADDASGDATAVAPSGMVAYVADACGRFFSLKYNTRR
jgi:hypothetical protein